MVSGQSIKMISSGTMNERTSSHYHREYDAILICIYISLIKVTLPLMDPILMQTRLYVKKNSHHKIDKHNLRH